MIRLPKKHIADSVVERITAVEQAMRPQVTNAVAEQGQRLDQALAAPIGDVAPIDGIEDAIPLRALDL